LSLIFLNTHGEVHVNLEKEIITVKEDQSLSYEMAENPGSKSKQSEDINPMSKCFQIALLRSAGAHGRQICLRLWDSRWGTSKN
jgi:hypothetical protein